MRVQVRLDLAQGRWAGLWLQHGREHEASGASVQHPVKAGGLWVVDRGYRSLGALRQLGEQGSFWLMPPVADLCWWDERGVRSSLPELLSRQTGEVVNLQVQVGAQQRLPARLIAVRVSAQQEAQRRQAARKEISSPPKGARRPNARKQPARTQAGTRNTHGDRHRKQHKTSLKRMALLGWTILLTNVPREQLSVQEALVLYRGRWQMELLWKLAKEIERVDTWRSEKPERILTEILAKWVGLLISHWVMLLECWADPRHSTVKAHQAMQWMAPVLAWSLRGGLPLEQALASSAAAMRRGCRIDPRRMRPATFQLLADPSLISP
jgi:hypothetical protein